MDRTSQPKSILKKVVVGIISFSLFTANYVIVPLGIVWIVAYFSDPIIALIAIPVIWMATPFTALLLTGGLYPLHGDKPEQADRIWLIGTFIGTSILTAVWFLPAWENNWPAFASILAPLRVSSMFDNFWYMGASWLACVPLMLSVSIGTTVELLDEKIATGEEKQTDTVDATAQREKAETKHKKTPHSSNGATQEQPMPSQLQYGWQSAPDTGFADVGGMEPLKTEIERTAIRPLTRLDAAYERFNISPPNGILFYGPPGTGKTLFARAIAGELGHPYLELSAGDIKSRWVNKSTEQVNRLFEEAAQFDRCVIFIDEIDALLASRESDVNREHTQVVNEFLAHLDADDPNYLVIAATNRAELLDEAATRRGRFDQQYELGLPDRDAREAIFRVRLDELPTDLDNNAYGKMADLTEGVSSADIAGVVDDAAMRAAERDADELTLEDLHMSLPDQPDHQS
ncbi:ATP-binding protein [Natrinema soli]|uniref:AAA family ATPase n=1 Tax=Natrinema soli TaxID=1930624 RepID=A0ABD5SGZ5_9EURY|nr:AAA family ATPase [Natrinema soli]